jgi:hypothetical protein
LETTSFQPTGLETPPHTATPPTQLRFYEVFTCVTRHGSTGWLGSCFRSGRGARARPAPWETGPPERGEAGQDSEFTFRMKLVCWSTWRKQGLRRLEATEEPQPELDATCTFPSIELLTLDRGTGYCFPEAECRDQRKVKNDARSSRPGDLRVRSGGSPVRIVVQWCVVRVCG